MNLGFESAAIMVSKECANSFEFMSCSIRGLARSRR